MNLINTVKQNLTVLSFSLIFFVLFHRVYKTQQIHDNKIRLYNHITRIWIHSRGAL